MIDGRTAKQEIERLKLAGLSFPPDADGLTTLAKALAKHASSERHAALVLERWIETWPQWPKPSELVQSCGLIADPTQESTRWNRKQCQRCNGTGWISVDGPHGTSAAYPCTHGPEKDADRRMGVQMHPSVQAHYRQLDIEAEDRRDIWVGSGGKPNVDELNRMNARTIGRILEGI